MIAAGKSKHFALKAKADPTKTGATAAVSVLGRVAKNQILNFPGI
jgi:hypothetical protein